MTDYFYCFFPADHLPIYLPHHFQKKQTLKWILQEDTRLVVEDTAKFTLFARTVENFNSQSTEQKFRQNQWLTYQSNPHVEMF